MQILVDADACPVVNIAMKLAKIYKLHVVLVCDTSHEMQRDGAETIIVSKGADSADFVLVNMVSKGDIVITQDYGLAAMCLAKNAIVLRQDGLEYSNDNIDALLSVRHTAKQVRMSGGRTRNIKKRSSQDDNNFESALKSKLSK